MQQLLEIRILEWELKQEEILLLELIYYYRDKKIFESTYMGSIYRF